MCILDSDQEQHHKPITSILDLTLHQIFIPFTHTYLGLMIFSLYRFRLLPIPGSKTMLNQYLGPNTKIPWTKYHGPKLRFPTCTRLSYCKPTCVHIRVLVYGDPTCIRILVKWNLRISLFPSFWEPILWSIMWVSCHQGQHLCHSAKPVSWCQQSPHLDLMATPSHSPPLSSRAKGYAPP